MVDQLRLVLTLILTMALLEQNNFRGGDHMVNLIKNDIVLFFSLFVNYFAAEDGVENLGGRDFFGTDGE